VAGPANPARAAIEEAILAAVDLNKALGAAAGLLINCHCQYSTKRNEQSVKAFRLADAASLRWKKAELELKRIADARKEREK